MSARTGATWPWLVFLALLVGAFAVAAVGDPGPQTTADRAQAIAESIKCPTCQGQSVADSNAAAARSIKVEIIRRLEAGQTDEQIRTYIASIYGEDQLLTPPRDGVAGLIWFLPPAAVVIGVGGLTFAFRRWRDSADHVPTPDDLALVEEAREQWTTP